MLSKSEFVEQVRAIVEEEPSRDQWVQMWNIYSKKVLTDLEKIVHSIMEAGIIHDSRLCSEIQKKESVPLSVLASWGASMAEQFSVIPQKPTYKRNRNVIS